MRKRLLILIVGGVASIALFSDALAAPKASVTDKVAKGENITVTATDCESGPGYTAFVDVNVYYKGTAMTAAIRTFSTPPGEMKIQMDQIGDFDVVVECRHDFDGGGSDTLYEEEESLTVTGLTAEERAKCKKKSTKKKRRNCKKRQKAD